MTPQSVLIAVITAITSMVLFAASISGAALALPLLVLTPLPIAICGLGWGSFTGLIAALLAWAGLSLITSLQSGLLFAALFGLPIAYLAHSAGLSRQDDPNEPEEWFPVGRILLRAVVIGGGVVGGALVVSGFDVDDNTKRSLTVFAEWLNEFDAQTRQAMKEAIAFQVRFTPYSMPMAWLLLMWLNLSLGIKITKLSERFRRPAFHLKDAELPLLILPAFGVAVLVSFIGPPLAHLGAAYVGICSMALIILGFNTLHVITKRNAFRGALLGTLYGTTFLFGLPAIPVFGIGLADLLFKIRQRYRAAHPD